MAYHNYTPHRGFYATTNDVPVLWPEMKASYKRERQIEALRKMEVEARHRKNYGEAVRSRDKRKEIEGAR